MKKKEENPVDENLGKIIEFLLSLPAVNVDNLKIEEVKDRHLCNTTVPELYIKWVVLGDKDAFLFRIPYDIKEKNRIYYPTKVENALKDYDEDGVFRYTVKVDNKFWYMLERSRMIGEIANFGIDMTPPFLSLQNWKVVEPGLTYNNDL